MKALCCTWRPMLLTWKPNIYRHPKDTTFRTFISCSWCYSS